MIPGAVPLNELNLDSTSMDENEVSIVTYCTIGYRSTVEARWLQERYPKANVYSLDGILADSYTGAPLINPLTGSPTKQIHAFAQAWEQFANTEYETHLFGYPGLVGRFIQVGAMVAFRRTQIVFVDIASCCRPRQ